MIDLENVPEIQEAIGRVGSPDVREGILQWMQEDPTKDPPAWILEYCSVARATVRMIQCHARALNRQTTPVA